MREYAGRRESNEPVKTKSARPGRTDSTRAVATTPPKPALEIFFQTSSKSVQCAYLLSQMERIMMRKEDGIPAMEQRSVFGEAVSSRIKRENLHSSIIEAEQEEMYCGYLPSVCYKTYIISLESNDGPPAVMAANKIHNLFSAST